MRQTRFGLFTLLISTSLIAPVQADNHTSREEYDIPEHGRLVMDVPVDWQAEFYQPQDDKFPVISFYPLDGPQVFQLSVSVFWTTSELRDLTAPGNLRRFVENVGKNILPRSDQDELALEEIVGHSGIGYMFELTDSSAGPEEYPYLTQGALGVGNIVVVFSLLTREESDRLKQLTLEMLKDARQDLERQDVNLHRPHRYDHPPRIN